jgi:tetratricopeptide (TPR) repeat protein
LANVLLHALNAGLVFVLLRQMTGARWRSLAVAALFAVHPLRVESVAWVSERKDVLSGFFGLLALIAYARYAQGGMQNAECRMQKSAADNAPHAPRFRLHVSRFTLHASYLLSLFLFALGLLSKPMLVTLPFVMLLLDYWPLGRITDCGMRSADSPLTPHASRFTFHVSRRSLLPLLVEKIPFFALAALVSAVTFVVQRRGGSLAMGESLPLGARGSNALISYCRHFGKLFWPADLVVFYPHPGLWPLGQVLLAGGVILGVSVLLFVRRQRYLFLLVGWLWFCGMLVPVIGLVQTGGQAMADRHTYLPSLGVLILAIWGACELTRGWRYQGLALSVAGGVAIVLCLELTSRQIGYWQDGETLFRHALAVTENNHVAHKGLGSALGKKGHLNAAILEFQEAIRLKPDNPDAYNSLGAAFGQKGQLDEAIRQFQEAARLKPHYADALDNLGAALVTKGQTDEAIRQFQEAIRCNPDHAEAHYNLGVALGMKGQTDEAIRQYQEASRLNPNNADAQYNLGLALAIKGQTDEAIRRFKAALKAQPNYPEAHNHLGLALGKKGLTDQAIGQFQEALRLKPGYAGARMNLDAALATGAHSPLPPGATSNP